MEKLVGKVTYVRIPKLGESYEMLGLTYLWKQSQVSASHLQLNALYSIQLWLNICMKIISVMTLNTKIISGINISLGASLVTELDDPGEKDLIFF